MAEKDLWGYCENLPDDGSWVVLGAEIIPLPMHKCLDGVPDWVLSGLPKEPTPYEMPVFVIDQLLSMKNGRKRVTLYMAQSPSRRGTRDMEEIKEKWRPVPPPLVPIEPEEPVITSRYKRAPVI